MRRFNGRNGGLSFERGKSALRGVQAMEPSSNWKPELLQKLEQDHLKLAAMKERLRDTQLRLLVLSSG